MQDMIDLHCHLLPGIDDGARDMDDAVAMAKQAEEDGVTAVCATPHIRGDHDVVVAELAWRRQEVAAAISQAGCPTRVLGGGEVSVALLDRLGDDELAEVALGETGRWILVEPAPGPLDDRFEDAVNSLPARGFRALIAHPERHPAPDLATRLARLVTRGALVQGTAAHVTDQRTGAGMLALARAGVLHVLGSDAHSSVAGRPVALTAALETLSTVDPVGAHLEWMAKTAPGAIVRGEDPGPPPWPVTAR
jgi:protein-tyrosine phosphatase